MNNNITQNIINIGNQTGCNQQPVCPGYMMYIPCLQNIIQGNDATISFYLLDKQGNTVNTNSIKGFITIIENQFGCQEVIGRYGEIDLGDSDSDSNTIDIDSLQKEYPTTIISDDFSDLNGYDEKFTDDIDKYYYIDGCFKDNGCLRLGYKSRCDNCGSTGILKLKPIELPNKFSVKLKVKNGTRNSSMCCVTVNGHMHIRPIPTSVIDDEIYDTDEWDELNFDDFDGIDGDVYLDIQSCKINSKFNYAEMKLKSYEIITTGCVTDEGLFSITLDSDTTSQMVRGDLKLTTTIVDINGNIYTTNCAIGGKIK